MRHGLTPDIARLVISNSSESKKGRFAPNQKGSTVLAMLAFVMVALAATFHRVLDPNPKKLADLRGTMNNLAIAASGLIAYSMRPNAAGWLPCPDLDFPPDGKANEECSLIQGPSMGWLPWITLGFQPLRDDSGTPLWYAVAEGYPSGSMDVDPKPFKMAGLSDLVAAAVVIAPGETLPGQFGLRKTIDDRDPARGFLEGLNRTACQKTGLGVFEQRPQSLDFNDRLLPLAVGIDTKQRRHVRHLFSSRPAVMEWP